MKTATIDSNFSSSIFQCLRARPRVTWTPSGPRVTRLGVGDPEGEYPDVRYPDVLSQCSRSVFFCINLDFYVIIFSFFCERGSSVKNVFTNICVCVQNSCGKLW